VSALLDVYNRAGQSPRSIVEHVRPGGVVAFQEPELAPWLGYVTCGSTPLAHQIYKWASAAFGSTGVDSSMSSVLYAAYRAAVGRAAEWCSVRRWAALLAGQGTTWSLQHASSMSVLVAEGPQPAGGEQALRVRSRPGRQPTPHCQSATRGGDVLRDGSHARGEDAPSKTAACAVAGKNTYSRRRWWSKAVVCAPSPVLTCCATPSVRVSSTSTTPGTPIAT